MRKKPQPSGVVTDKGQRRAAEEADRDAKKKGEEVIQLHFNLVRPQS